MILETYNAERLSNGAWRRETQHEEFETKEELYHALFLYKMGMNLGYRIYDCDMKTYHTDKNKDRLIIEEWYDRASIRRTQQ